MAFECYTDRQHIYRENWDEESCASEALGFDRGMFEKC
jgi:hypothetical protein